VVAARRAAPLKPRLGPLAYAAGALRAGLTARPLRDVVVDADGATVHTGDAWQVVVGATGAFGGGSGLDAADPEDGLLDVVVLVAGSRAALVRRAWGLRLGRITRQPGVVHARARQVAVRLPVPTLWNVDGEVCDLEPATFGAERGAVEVVVP
jgi:diacylglycerol kinase family enzyme